MLWTRKSHPRKLIKIPPSRCQIRPAAWCAPHLTPPRAPPPEPSCGRPMYGEDRRVACKFRSTIPVGAFGRVWFVPWRARRAKMWPFLHGAALGDFPRSTAPPWRGWLRVKMTAREGKSTGPRAKGSPGRCWGSMRSVSCGRPLLFAGAVVRF